MTGGLEMAYTDFLQLVQARQSDRSYDKERPVEPEKLERVLEAARLAPSACNAQPWRFVVITDKVRERHFRDALKVIEGMSLVKKISSVIRVYGD